MFQYALVKHLVLLILHKKRHHMKTLGEMDWLENEKMEVKTAVILPESLMTLYCYIWMRACCLL